MKYYAIINKDENIIDRTIITDDSVIFLLNENEERIEVNSEIVNQIGDKQATFEISGGAIIITGLIEKPIVPPPPTTEDRLLSLEAFANFQLGLGV